MAQALYDVAVADAVGPALRTPGAHPWTMLVEPDGGGDDCRLLEDEMCHIRAYAWRGERLHGVEEVFSRFSEDLIVGEVVADGPAAADAVLGVCLDWAREESVGRGREIRHVVLPLPPGSSPADAAFHTGAIAHQRSVRCGDSMVRVLDTGRLLRSLAPELSRRLLSGRERFNRILEVLTDAGDTSLRLTDDGVVVGDHTSHGRSASSNSLKLCLPQAVLARLVLGAFPSRDLLDRLPHPPSEGVYEVVERLFPRRHPHMYLADRY